MDGQKSFAYGSVSIAHKAYAADFKPMTMMSQVHSRPSSSVMLESKQPAMMDSIRPAVVSEPITLPPTITPYPHSSHKTLIQVKPEQPAESFTINPPSYPEKTLNHFNHVKSEQPAVVSELINLPPTINAFNAITPSSDNQPAMQYIRPAVIEPTSTPILQETPNTLNNTNITKPTPIENPIGDLKELCDFVRTPYEKRFEEEGHAHSKKYKCVLTFCGKKFESDWMTSQKEAEKMAALRLLYILPCRKVDDKNIQQRGSSHEMHFRVVINAQDENGNPIEFASDWMKKKLEARRDVMQKLVKHYFGDTLSSSVKAMSLEGPARSSYMATPGGSASGPAARTISLATPGMYSGAREHYIYSSDDTMTKVQEFLTKWQNKHLNIIKNIVGVEGNDPLLNGLLTVAFIHPSFTHSEELKECVKRCLNVKWASYERLEFFGDAVLGFVASKLLFEESDSDGPHELTIKRQKMVREDACCSCMKRLGLDRYVIHRDILQSPSAKVLCDIYEAIIGAIYVVMGEEGYPTIIGLINRNREWGLMS